MGGRTAIPSGAREKAMAARRIPPPERHDPVDEFAFPLALRAALESRQQTTEESGDARQPGDECYDRKLLHSITSFP